MKIRASLRQPEDGMGKPARAFGMGKKGLKWAMKKLK
jgi:hypothetical protein